ncbi:MAG TPA: hypothetical protein VGL81_29895 [Polyangiaceae bacterium]|jgi:hypothetical protein
MKKRYMVAAAAVTAGWLALAPADAVAGFSTAPAPSLTVTNKFILKFDMQDDVSFSGDDFCGPAYHPIAGTLVDVTCGHTVFVGIWQPGPSGGGAWAESVTLQSTAGGMLVQTSGVGLVSGGLTVWCGNPNGELYAYDLDEGTLITGASINSFACIRF